MLSNHQETRKFNYITPTIIVFTLITRIIFLNKFPIGITHDELNYIISAKSLFINKSFAPGTAPALLPTEMKNYTVTVAEVPSLILSPLIGNLPMSLFNARMIGAIFNTITGIALYLLSMEITKSKKTALISLLLFAINPWSFLMGRSVFEVNFYLAFMLLGLLVLIKNKEWKIFYSFPLFILGFLSYVGGQVSFLIFITISLIYHYFSNKDNKNYKNIYIAYLFIFIMIFLSYTYLATHNQTSIARGKEIYTPFSQEVKDLVDNKRKLSLKYGENIFINKATIYLSGFIQKYLTAFSTNTLFIKGETRAAFSYQDHGTFYYFEILFILIGTCYLFSFNKRKFTLILGIIATAPITSGLSNIEFSYSQRAGLMFPFLIMLSAMGVNYLLGISKNLKIKTLIHILIFIIYTLSFINLLHIYFFRFPVYASDGWFLQDRILSRYITLSKSNNPEKEIVVITNEPKIIFEEYLFFNNLYNKELAPKINKLLEEKNYTIEKITFTDTCPKQINENTTYILYYQNICEFIEEAKNPVLRIADIKQNQEIYLILNDKLCQPISLNEYYIPQKTNDFDIEDMDRNQFCLKWITKNK